MSFDIAASAAPLMRERAAANTALS